MYNQKIHDIKKQEELIDKHYAHSENILRENIITQTVVTETHTVPNTAQYDMNMHVHVDSDGHQST